MNLQHKVLSNSSIDEIVNVYFALHHFYFKLDCKTECDYLTNCIEYVREFKREGDRNKKLNKLKTSKYFAKLASTYTSKFV